MGGFHCHVHAVRTQHKNIAIYLNVGAVFQLHPITPVHCSCTLWLLAHQGLPKGTSLLAPERKSLRSTPTMNIMISPLDTLRQPPAVVNDPCRLTANHGG